MITAVFLVGTLTVGSLGGLMQSASARDNYSSRNNNYYGNANSNRNSDRSDRNQSTNESSRNTSNESTTTTSRTTTPPATPAVTPAPAAPVAPTPTPAEVVPVQAPVTPQIVSQPVVAEPVEDTAPAIAKMAVAQTDKNTEAVAYTSAALSDETRDRLFIFAGIATVAGALLYTLSVIGAAAPASKRAIPVRYIVPVREAITS